LIGADLAGQIMKREKHHPKITAHFSGFPKADGQKNSEIFPVHTDLSNLNIVAIIMIDPRASAAHACHS
jgi:hypothetical protein